MKLIIEIPESVYETYKLWHENKVATVEQSLIANSKPYEERPQVDCEKCDFRKFSETFIDGVVDVMNKNGITSVEQLSELLKGGAKNEQ